MDNPPVIDLSEALKRTMGDADFLKMMLEEFMKTVPDFINRIENAIKEKDMVLLANDAHQLKGAAANLAAKAVAATALKLEQIGKNENPQECDQALQELKQAFDNLGSHLDRLDWAGLGA